MGAKFCNKNKIIPRAAQKVLDCRVFGKKGRSKNHGFLRIFKISSSKEAGLTAMFTPPKLDSSK